MGNKEAVMGNKGERKVTWNKREGDMDEREG